MTALLFLSILLTWLASLIAGFGIAEEKLSSSATTFVLLLSILLMTLTLWLAMNFN